MGFYLLFLVILILQMLLVIKQSRHIAQEYLAVKKQLSGNAQVGMGTFRSLRSLKKGRIIILAMENDKVIDFRELSGRTVFSKFRQVEAFINLSMDELLSESTAEQKKAITIAITNFSKQEQQEGIKWT
ncbi:transcriptional regulator GutM [Candidatus Enterococcus ferrettii]|uniref:Glucitol operon activator protein n=1 Tax=Candidatus Enterococcus ferrettii TaxID=2815324 RepID=A0ABV0EKX7_9ENTE|nr:transcriptional regulator GutM [Enterococcus sp. 665A]MBO1340464.1 hypothetical protein [Enterococcus sp. 665A]